MKIDIDKAGRPAYNAFICIVSELGKEKAFLNVLDKRTSESNELDIVLTINGEEFNFIELVEKYDQQLDEIVKREALNLIQRKLSDSIDKLDKIKDLTEQYEKQFKEKLGIREDQYD